MQVKSNSTLFPSTDGLRVHLKKFHVISGVYVICQSVRKTLSLHSACNLRYDTLFFQFFVYIARSAIYHYILIITICCRKFDFSGTSAKFSH